MVRNSQLFEAASAQTEGCDSNHKVTKNGKEFTTYLSCLAYNCLLRQ